MGFQIPSHFNDFIPSLITFDSTRLSKGEQTKIGCCSKQHPIFIYANLSNRGEALNNNTTTTAVNKIEGMIYVELYIVE